MAIRAGQRILALDWAGYAGVWDGGNETDWNSTTYTAGTTPVGLTFVAPTSGAVLAHWHARLSLNSATASRVMASIETRAGSIIGSGAVVSTPSDDVALEIGQDANSRLQGAMTRDITGLTPGATYNIRLLYRNDFAAAAAGNIYARSIYTLPIHP